MTDQRITCPRHHWLFSVTTEGIAIKCRSNLCRATVHIVTWDEIEAKRLQVMSEQIQEVFAIPIQLGGEIHNR